MYRESNSLTDYMAKQGVRRYSDFIAWFWSISQLISIRLLKVLHFESSNSLERWIGDSWKFPWILLWWLSCVDFNVAFLGYICCFVLFIWTLLHLVVPAKLICCRLCNFICRQVMAFNKIIYFSKKKPSSMDFFLKINLKLNFFLYLEIILICRY